MEHSEEYVYGTPSAEESSKLWKRFPGEPGIDSEAYEAATISLERHLAKRYALFGSQADLYLRGDFFGDRTQYVELYLPELIGPEFIAYLQNWLRSYEGGAWRAVIPTYFDDAAGAIMVYPDLVRFASKWKEDAASAYQAIPKLMRADDKSGTYKKKA